jgi:predicted MFS family arabinose efflux permease
MIGGLAEARRFPGARWSIDCPRRNFYGRIVNQRVPDVTEHTRRNVFLLAICQALFMTSTSAVGAMGVLVGYALAPDKGLATLPLAFQFGAMMLVTIPASIYMKRVGRRVGFMTGAVIATIGAVTATVAMFTANFWLFCGALVFLGSFNGISQYLRFAASDASDTAFRSRAISLVLAGGVVAGVTGPNLAVLTKDLFQSVEFAGTFASLVAVYAALFAIVVFIRIPKPTAEERAHSGRKLFEIVRQPTFMVAVLGATMGYVVMIFLMTITPLAMAQHRFEFADSAIVIQGHIVGMFLPSFFTGSLIARYGVTNVMIWGALMLLAAVAINVSGFEFLYFFSGLALLGVAWNFLFIGGTTLLTQCYTPAEKAKTQGLNDFIVFGSVSVGTLVSGMTHAEFGWKIINLGIVPLILLTLGATLWLKYRRQPAIARPPATTA